MKGKVAKVIEILHHYGQVFDIFNHTELTSFIWDEIRWLVQVCQAYLLKWFTVIIHIEVVLQLDHTTEADFRNFDGSRSKHA